MERTRAAPRLPQGVLLLFRTPLYGLFLPQDVTMRTSDRSLFPFLSLYRLGKRIIATVAVCYMSRVGGSATIYIIS
jgi:hypothetical protein